jgi:hypothetical protein
MLRVVDAEGWGVMRGMGIRAVHDSMRRWW